jgi:putative methyltransferase (TIGR04325 family)
MLRKCLRFAKDVYRYATFSYSQFRGVYNTFSEANEAVPASQKIGYNHAELARLYGDVDLRRDSADYPALLHLHRAIREGSSVLDFGGNVGDRYLRYREFLLRSIEWTVWDFPEITKVGQEVCDGVPNITFVNDIESLRGRKIDVFLACGSFQYVEFPASLFRDLSDRGVRPAHIIIDHIPLYEGARYVTLQNGGPVYYPQYVFNRQEYVASIENLGYRLRDTWSVSTHSCIVPFHRDKSVTAYTGLYFAEHA